MNSTLISFFLNFFKLDSAVCVLLAFFQELICILFFSFCFLLKETYWNHFYLNFLIYNYILFLKDVINSPLYFLRGQIPVVGPNSWISFQDRCVNAGLISGTSFSMSCTAIANFHVFFWFWIQQVSPWCNMPGFDDYTQLAGIVKQIFCIQSQDTCSGFPTCVIHKRVGVAKPYSQQHSV